MIDLFRQRWESNRRALRLFAAITILFYTTPSVTQTEPCTNDPQCTNQWHLGEQGSSWLNLYHRLQVAGKHIEPVTIAILDSGIQSEHPDLLPIDTAYSCGVIGQTLETLSCAPPEDEYGHGTIVSGQFLAKSDNAMYGAGALPGLLKEPIIVKVMQPNGVANYSDISTGLAYLLSLLDQGVAIDVVTLSIAGDPLIQSAAIDSNLIEVIKEQLQQLVDRGVILVAGAGNDAGEVTHFPANQPTVIDVGASTKEGIRWENSSYGGKSGSDWQILAPGVDIGSVCLPNDFCFADGTSMATPQVAQAVALIKSFLPTATLAEVKALLHSASVVTTPRNAQEPEFRILNFELLADQLAIPDIDTVYKLFLPLVLASASELEIAVDNKQVR